MLVVHQQMFAVLRESTLQYAKEPPHGLGLHFAAVVKRRKVIAIARNYSKSTWRYEGYDKSVRDINASRHAERAVIEKLGNMADLRDAEMFVWRVGHANDVSHSDYNSKPCAACEAFLIVCFKKWGLRKVTYSIGS